LTIKLSTNGSGPDWNRFRQRHEVGRVSTEFIFSIVGRIHSLRAQSFISGINAAALEHNLARYSASLRVALAVNRVTVSNTFRSTLVVSYRD
jgi:hypothetical protein